MLADDVNQAYHLGPDGYYHVEPRRSFKARWATRLAYLALISQIIEIPLWIWLHGVELLERIGLS